jgi:hypothetical protein
VQIEWPAIYRAFRDLLVTSTALVLLVIEVRDGARTEVLMMVASMLGLPAYLRGSAAIKKAANGSGEK